LFIYPFWLDGAAVGGAALVSCMTVETVYIVIVSRPLLAGLEKKKETPPAFSEIWRFSWPLMITQSSEGGIPLVINFFLGRLSNPDLALAGFGVVMGLVRAILSPLRNLVQTAQTLVSSNESLRVMMRFGLATVLFFLGTILTLFYSPLESIILGKIMGLKLELSQYAIPGVKLTFLVAIFWGYSALLRGTLSAMRRTGAIAFTVLIRLAVVVLVCSVTTFLPELNGATVGVLAFGGAFAAESMFLAVRLKRHFKSGKLLFSHI
jgi:Na+-driven multidrug efflux pump